MRIETRVLATVFASLLLTVSAFGQRQTARPTGSGGVLIYEQAAYDVEAYDITSKIEPASKSISGTTLITAEVVSPLEWFVFDLDTPFEVSDVTASFTGRDDTKLEFERRGGKFWARFPTTVQPGKTIRVAVTYSGKPRIAPNPPWAGGFMWEKKSDRSHVVL